MAFLPRSMTPLVNGFPFVEQILSPIGELLVTARVYMPLLFPWAYIVVVIVVVHRHQSCVGLLAAVFF